MTMKDDRIYVDQSFFEQYLDADITVDGASATAAASSMASTRNTIRANDYDVKRPTRMSGMRSWSRWMTA